MSKNVLRAHTFWHKGFCVSIMMSTLSAKHHYRARALSTSETRSLEKVARTVIR
ncbi:hypothetical protein COCSUDRAFT_33908 [Coccomyxa subellipsoidea C-169]|uniref:Uncharacterized protein n=1 Tax=Coccomyxa subellipsoidea (strain C-169) TaxID=574566 RepID=I0YR12_COCSC|nr:hypothetical protein COCSUDRAFT_33908 [Coccomyxa subellipsoidea C-169]EIE20831.1 hypothetical protein COCSUDRAFT_33908 [Coccomyxa subellipsoidea C-169]|eukprot:XP_005645375.1 hypothetical protein COCSUDRAFT_33908 [Coccomyxa subellipsoidea C-169]